MEQESKNLGKRRWRASRILWGVWIAGWMASPSSATTLVYNGDVALAEQSQAVVIAKVAGVRAEPGERGGVRTRVSLEEVQVVAGAVAPGSLELLEWGGELGERNETIFGAPQYRKGERVLVFLERTSGGNWRTTNLALGKYALLPQIGGSWKAVRKFEGAALFDLRKRRLVIQPPPAERDVGAVIEDVRQAFLAKGSAVGPVELPDPEQEWESPAQPFTLLGQARWFEVDAGLPVRFFLDSGGQTPLDPQTSQAAVEAGMAAWNGVSGSFLRLELAGRTSPVPFSGCPEENSITFDDPFQEVNDPTNCSGILALGGFCTSGTTATFAGAKFAPITVAKIVFNNGWASCGIWTPCNLAEVATHELGHTIGLGHSTDRSATMAPVAHFDGRCAALEADDVAGVRFLYGTPAPDLVVLPVAPVTVRIPSGQAETTKRVTVAVRDAARPLAASGLKRTVQLLVHDGDCPVGTLEAADFDPALPGAQSVVDLDSGRPRTASLTVHLRAAEVMGTPQSPFRCTAFVEVQSAGGETAEQNPQNNSVPIVLNVIDGNDVAAVSRTQPGRETVLASLKPVRISLSKTMPFQMKEVRIRLRNADVGTFSQHLVRVDVQEGDCPAGTLSGWDFGNDPGDQHEVDIPPNRSAVGTLTIIPPPAGFYSPNRQSPARCTMWITAAAVDGETNLTNNVTPLVIDVVDHGDF